MTVTDVDTDRAAQTFTIASEFDAPVGRCWQLWADPRQLERWWGPPTYPATMVEHDLTPGGHVTYYMTGPDGQQFHGWWHVIAVDAPNTIEFEDGFGDSDGNPNADLPSMTIQVTLAPRTDGGTRMTITTTFPSIEAMDQVIAMGMVEGITAALGQIEGILAGDG